MSIFSIQPSDIQSLDDATARELVARLAQADLRSQDIPESAVTWGGDQRAADGGVDVRVATNRTVASGGFAPCSSTIFQVKAEKFGPAKVISEMAPSGALRDEIAILGGGGAYVIVSTRDSCSDSMINSRVQAMEATLSHIEEDKRPKPAFYDARQLADWVEKHPPVATWLREELGRSLRGWQPFGPWAHQQSAVDETFLLDDDQERAVLPNGKSSTLAMAISSLRQDLIARRSVRLVGLSGVGKTRLASALFQSEVETETPNISPELAVYTDLSHEPDPSPQLVLQSLLDSGADAVLIVDNCGPQTHGRLVENLNRVPEANRRTALLTIEYDVRDDLPERTRCYRLAGSSDALIFEILRQKGLPISELDARTVAAFSDGNARVAIALAATAAERGQLAELQSAELFDRLFLQNNTPNEDLRWHAAVVSALYSFNGESVDEGAELAQFASLAGVSTVQLQRSLGSLASRGLLQSRGPWRALLPHAIANTLARELLDTLNVQQLLSALITGGDDRTARSFTRRLSYIYEHPRAIEIASQLLREDGPLGQPASLKGMRLDMFGNLAAVDPDAALAAIERSIASGSLYDSKGAVNSDIKRIVSAIAYDEMYFKRCIEALAKIARREPADHRNEPARDQLLSLFSISVSGTYAPITMRQEVCKSWLSSDDTFLAKLGFEALAEALNSGGHHRHFVMELGSRSRDYGWRPRTRAEAEAWFESWAELTFEFAVDDEAIGQVRKLVADAFRHLWSFDKMLGFVESIANRLLDRGPWPEGWRAARQAYYYDGDGWSEPTKARLIALVAKLDPSSLEERIQAQVFADDPFGEDFGPLLTMQEEERSPTSRMDVGQKSINDLGLEAAENLPLIEQILPQLLSIRASGAQFSFGRGVGQIPEAVSALLPILEDFLARCDTFQASALFIRGLVKSWSENDPEGVEAFFNRAKDAAAWLPWFVELQTVVELDERAVGRLLEVVTKPECSTHSFGYLKFGQNTAPLSVDQVMSLIEAIAAQPNGGLPEAIDVLHMVVHGTDEQEDAYVQRLRPRVWGFLKACDWDDLANYGQRLSYHIKSLLTFSMPPSLQCDEFDTLLSKVAPMDEDNFLKHDDPRRLVMEQLLKRDVGYCLDHLIARDDDTEHHWRTRETIRGSFFGEERFALKNGSVADLIEWCRHDPEDRFPFVASQYPALEFANGRDHPSGINEGAKALLLASEDKQAVMSEFVSNFRPNSWSGSMATILESRRPLLDQFDEPSLPEVSAAVAVAKQNLDRWAKEEKVREDRRNQEENLTFE